MRRKLVCYHRELSQSSEAVNGNLLNLKHYMFNNNPVICL